MMGSHDKPGTHLPESTLQTKQALQIQKKKERKKKFFIIRHTFKRDLVSASIFPLSYTNGLLWLHSPGGVMCLG